MFLGDHHEWVKFAANQLQVGGMTLWQARCAEYASRLLDEEADTMRLAIETALL